MNIDFNLMLIFHVPDSKIYMIGGVSTTADRVLKSVECYDTRTCSWLPEVEDLPQPARWICCAALPAASPRSARPAFRDADKKILSSDLLRLNGPQEGLPSYS